MKTLLLALAAVSASANPGVTVSLSLQGAQYVLDTAIPIVEATLQNITIPAINTSKDGFDIVLSNIGCNTFDLGEGAVTMDPLNGIGITLDDINLACSADWSFRLHSWPHIPSGSGSATVGVSSTTASLGVDVTASPDGSGVPVLSANNVQLDIADMDIHFSGSLWDWLLNLLKDLFAGAIRRTVSSTFEKAVNNFIDNNVNARLANVSLNFPLKFKAPYNISEVQFGLTDSPTFNVSYAGFPLAGQITDISNPQPAPFPAPNIPWFDYSAANRFVQIHLSEYTILSGIYTFYNAGLMTWPVPSDRIPLGLNNSNSYGLIAPGMPIMFPNLPVNIQLGFLTMPTVTIAENGMSVDIPLTAAFNVQQQSGGSESVTAFVLGVNASLSVNMTVGPNSDGVVALQGHVNFVNANLGVVSSEVGPVTIPLLNGLIQYIFNGIVVPAVNDILAPGIPLPSVGALAVLKNTELDLFTGYLCVGTDFALNVTTSEQPRVRETDAYSSFLALHNSLVPVILEPYVPSSGSLRGKQ